jgi:hypothetical protein
MAGHVDRMIGRIKHMKPRELQELRGRALRELERRPEDPDALRVLAAIEERLATPDPARCLRVGRIDWEPYNVLGCRGFVDGTPVARIFVKATHTATRKDVYSVEVLGTTLPDRFHHIAEARAAGSAMFERLQDRRGTDD